MNALKPHLRGQSSYPYKKVEARIKLDQNESPYDIPAKIKSDALERISSLDWNRYPDLHADDVRAAIGAFIGVPADWVVVSPGSNLLIQALAQAANNIIDTAPAFPHYAFSAKISGTPYHAVPLKYGPEGFSLDVPPMQAAMQKEPSVVFVPQPHAPTGKLFEFAAIQALALEAKRTDSILVIDEAYQQFSATNYLPLLQGNPNVAILRTFSKAWGLGGIRAGYMVASPELCTVIQNFIPPFGLPAHTAAVLLCVLEAPEYTDNIAALLTLDRDRLQVELKKVPGWKVYDSDTNFVLVKTPDAETAFNQLLKGGILVRRQDHYAGLEGCIRISVGTPEENQQLAEILKTISKENIHA